MYNLVNSSLQSIDIPTILMASTHTFQPSPKSSSSPDESQSTLGGAPPLLSAIVHAATTAFMHAYIISHA